MVSWLLLVFELTILFLTSKFIFQALYFLSYKIFRSESSATIPLFLLFFPGVIIHEISHLLIAEILFVKSYHMEIWPKVINRRVQMGSIQIQNTDLIRRVLIGVAPIIVGIVFLSSILLIFITNIGAQNIFSSSFSMLMSALVIWAVFVVTNTMFSSKKDIEGALELVLALSFLFFVFIITSIILSFDLAGFVQSLIFNTRVLNIIENLIVLLSFPVILNAVIYILAKAFLKKFILGRVV